MDREGELRHKGKWEGKLELEFLLKGKTDMFFELGVQEEKNVVQEVAVQLQKVLCQLTILIPF